MATTRWLDVTLLLFCFKLCYSRTENLILRINGGNDEGRWGKTEFCPDGMYAAGYELKVQPFSIASDNTALNGIKLICRNKGTSSSCSDTTITSSVGLHGEWNGKLFCPEGSFLVDFTLEMENYHLKKVDEMGAQFISFNCRDSSNDVKVQKLERYPIFNGLRPQPVKSATCPLGSYICGIKTRVQFQYKTAMDNTGLNDVIMFCCL